MHLQQSAPSALLPLGLLHVDGMGGVSRVPPRIPAARQFELEPMRQERSRHLHQPHPPGPGGQPKLSKRCREGRASPRSNRKPSAWRPARHISPSLLQVLSNGRLLSILCGKKGLAKLQSSVNPVLQSSSGGCLNLLFVSDFSNTKRHSGFRGFYTEQGQKQKRRLQLAKP